MADLPLRESTFLVLTALAAESRHGYTILGEVQQITDQRVHMHAGTLYGILDRLLGDGLVEIDHEEVVASRLRRYYRLTLLGRTLLQADTDRQHRNAAAASRRLRGLARGTAR
jgi:DNA-binding PadR family transcriptional regulator